MLEPVARGGFGLTEAPRLAADGTVWFTDVTGGGVFRIPPGSDAVEEVLAKRRGIGGLVLHEQGVVVSGRDVRLLREDGSQHELFAAGEDTTVTGFNDLAVDPNGWVIAGALRSTPPGQVLVIGPTFIAVACDAGLGWPNGMGFSADGRSFYVSDFADGRVLRADVDRQGAIAETLVPWAAVDRSGGASCDGLATDADGGVWVATGGGADLVRFDAAGAVSARVPVPGATFVSSLAFAGREVVVTAMGDDGGLVLRGTFDVAGTPVPLAHV